MKDFDQSAPRNVICAFYASTTYGSEYRAGLEFIRFAAAHGFDTAIIADLEEAGTAETIEAEAPGIRVIRIPAPVKKQAILYRYTDVFPQIVWHFRVARWLRQNRGALKTIWVQNGALPWLPLTPYFGLSPTLIWGPVGGGEPPTLAMMRILPFTARMRERLRSLVEQTMLKRKFAAAERTGAPHILAIARTAEAQRRLATGLGTPPPLIPEILDPLRAVHIERTPTLQPRFIWVGQDIPRKNLQAALDIFQALRRDAFPDATLDIFGCDARGGAAVPGLTYHGWVPKIDWPSFRNDGILLLTSFREGLPSAVLEALQNGLLCVTSDVGAIGGLGVPTVYTLPREEYPFFSSRTLSAVTDRIRGHLAQTRIDLSPVSHLNTLSDYLKAEGALP